LKKLISGFLVAACLVSSPYIGQAAKVVIDPGHGGTDPGTVGINGLYEKTVNNSISYTLRDLLIENGYEVVMTRSKDRTLSLQERVAIAAAADADLYVSVHANAHPSASIRGSMVLYHDAAYPNPQYPASPEMTALSPESKRLAHLVLSSMLEQVPNTNRGLVPSSAYVVRMGSVPSILVETAFLSNAQDAKLLASSAIRDKYALGIYNGIQQYMPPTFSDVRKHWARESILRLHEQGIANGNENKFLPDHPLTRAELAALAQRAFGFSGGATQTAAASPADQEPTVTADVYAQEAALEPGAQPQPPSIPSFTDLSEQHWSYGTMQTAISHGVLRGYPDGTVRPDAPVTRAEVAVVLDRLVGSTIPAAAPVAFLDVNLQNWAYSSIMRLSAVGIVRGFADQNYGPDRQVTRAEMAAMVDRQLTRSTLIVSADQTNPAVQ
jgi:N-acetylmuramoyl-L-alanine amidase